MKQFYDPKDKRFKTAHKEAIIGIIIVILNFLLWYGFAYGMGSGDPREYKYILGMPEWFFYSCIVATIISTLLVIISVKFLFKEVSFEEDGSEK
nr:YhdT family protein [uncultured Bacillus sp.]